jgi:hypothetical protein
MDASESPARNVGIVGAGRQGWRSGEIGAAAEAAGGGLGTMGNLADALADGAGDEEELEDFEELEEEAHEQADKALPAGTMRVRLLAPLRVLHVNL